MNRHIIFVAHSYGGLVVKQALLLAETDSKQRYIVDATKAVLFLGTPHRGSSFSRWGWWQAQALRLFGSEASLLSDLDYDSVSLQELHNSFTKLSREGMSVVNFYEQRPLRIAQFWRLKWQLKCVHESSATYGGARVDNFGLSVDHYNLNKYGSRDDNYRFILSKLRDITSAMAMSVQHSFAIPLETVESYIQREELWSELNKKLQIRHERAGVPYAVAISGLGGVGKSQLALKYAESNKDRYNPTLWVDATNAESVLSSFQRCAAELGLPETRNPNQASSLADDVTIVTVLRWLRERSEADDEWLVIIDNADDSSFGLETVMPKGRRGSVIITSQDELSCKLISRGCEKVLVGDMSSHESKKLLLHHLGNIPDGPLKSVVADCEKVTDQLGHLALAIDLAGVYIGNEPDPVKAIAQYLDDYKRHRDELLQMNGNGFRGLKKSEKTVWTVWDTTIKKIARDNPQLYPQQLLTFLAFSRDSVVQDEILDLAARRFNRLPKIGGKIPCWLQNFLSTHKGSWDKFQYRETCKILLRYHLLKRVAGKWPGVTMHGLVQWRARRGSIEEIMPWEDCHLLVIAFACSQLTEETHRPEFRRHLIHHLPQASELCKHPIEHSDINKLFANDVICDIYYDEGRWDEAEMLQVYIIESSEALLGKNHIDTPNDMIQWINLTYRADLYKRQGRLEEAEQLQEQIIEQNESKLGITHLDTLESMGILAGIFWIQDKPVKAVELQTQLMVATEIRFGIVDLATLKTMARLAMMLEEQGELAKAERLMLHVMKTHKSKLEADDPEALKSMANLASLFIKQRRFDEAEKLEIQVVEARKRKLGKDHLDTLQSMNFLARILLCQGRLKEAENLSIQVMGASKNKFGQENLCTQLSIDNLVKIYIKQGRLEEAGRLSTEIPEVFKRKLVAKHLET